MLTNFADNLKSFHNVDLTGILGIGLVEWRGIGWGRNQSLVGNVNISRTSPFLFDRSIEVIQQFNYAPYPHGK
jgi:hypothetical protein